MCVYIYLVEVRVKVWVDLEECGTVSLLLRFQQVGDCERTQYVEAGSAAFCVGGWVGQGQYCLVNGINVYFIPECGPNFTSKLEGMFRDMEISRETMSSFKEVRNVIFINYF